MHAALQEASPDGMFWKKKLGCEQEEGGRDSVTETVDEDNTESQRAQETLLREVQARSPSQGSCMGVRTAACPPWGILGQWGCC